MFHKWLLALFVLAAHAIVACSMDVAGPTYKGVEVAIDLPPQQRMKNTGGSDGPRGPGSGSGLCVFTSIQHAAIFQSVSALDGFREWMTHKPGGGYPEKVTQMIQQFCKERGRPVPAFYQYEGDDPTILQLAIASGRMPCITYDGRDKHYSQHIEHMVNLEHGDGSMWTVMDNNFIGDDELVWLSRDEFISRWVGKGASGRQAWAVILLDVGCPPLEPRVVVSNDFADPDAIPPPTRPVAGSWGGGGCPPSGLVSPIRFAPQPAFQQLEPTHVWRRFSDDDSQVALLRDGRQVGNYNFPRRKFFRLQNDKWFEDSLPSGVGPPPIPEKYQVMQDEPRKEEKTVENHGIMRDHMGHDEKHSLNGKTITRFEAIQLFEAGIPDDAKKPFLVVSAPTAALAKEAEVALAALTAWRVKAYAEGDFHLKDRNGKLAFAPGITACAVSGKQLGVVALSDLPQLVAALRVLPPDFDPLKLPELLKPKPPEPKPPEPAPIPTPQPQPAPVVPAGPSVWPEVIPLVLMGLFVGAVLLVRRKG